MGCCVCKIQLESNVSELSFEEKPIILSERRHPFSTYSSNQLYKEFFINDNDGITTKRNFLRACNNLETDPELETYSLFYENIRSDFQNFFTEKLILLSILMGQGSIIEKSSRWFEYYDRRALGKLDKKIIEMMIDKLVEISTCTSPLLAAEQLGARTVVSYGTKLRKKKKNLIRRLTDILVGHMNELTFEEFMAKMDTNSQLEHMMFTSGVRYLLMEEKNNPYQITESDRKKESVVMKEVGIEYWKMKTPMIFSDFSSEVEKCENNDDVFLESGFSEPESPILVEIEIKGNIEEFLIYPSEDTEVVAEAFCAKNNLSQRKKRYLISELEKAKLG